MPKSGSATRTSASCIEGQPVKVKFAAFPFQKYGMVEGTVEHVSAGLHRRQYGSSRNSGNTEERGNGKAQGLVYKALIALKAMHLELGEAPDIQRFTLNAGMQANAEILLGTRTVMEYLLSPVRKAWHEAGRER